MANLSLDEYRLMLATQLWLKESIFDFIETLLGSSKSSSNSNPPSDMDESLRKVTEQLQGVNTNTSRRRSKISRINEEKADSSLKEDLSKLRDKFKEMQNQTGKQESVDDPEKEKVNLSDWTMLVHDNSAKRDQKQDLLVEKLKHYKSNGYIK